MESNRLRKVTALLQQDIAEVLREIAQTRFKGLLLTVSGVRVSPDLGYARVYISVFPSDKGKEVIDWIQKEKSYIKDQVVRKLKGGLRQMPDLEFYLDDSLDYKDNIERLLKGDGDSPIS
jgi:ribosome-binding factor A